MEDNCSRFLGAKKTFYNNHLNICTHKILQRTWWIFLRSEFLWYFLPSPPPSYLPFKTINKNYRLSCRLLTSINVLQIHISARTAWLAYWCKTVIKDLRLLIKYIAAETDLIGLSHFYHNHHFRALRTVSFYPIIVNLWNKTAIISRIYSADF